MNFQTEDDFWNDYYDRQAEAERDVIRDAENMADLYEFETDEERDEYINELIRQGMEELECSFR